MRLKPIEKLAREICWIEFHLPTRTTLGRTKAACWSALPGEMQDEYVRRAEWWLAMYRKLPVDLINEVENA